MAIATIGEQAAAHRLAALGSAVRLRVFKALIRAGREGSNVTDLQRALGIPPTTLGHHLGTLVEAGLVAQERRGRELICRARYDAVREVSAFLMAECCSAALRAAARAA